MAPKNKKPKPTGFEEFYTDPPTTPDEYKFELELYDGQLPFEERIEVAVSRFASKRRFGEMQAQIFNKYLTYGGIDSRPKQFTGGQNLEDENLSKRDIEILKSSYSVEDWVIGGSAEVDFDGVLQSFISTHASSLFNYSAVENIKGRVGIIRNFLNYLLYHNVCDEYKGQVEAARRTCDIAERELVLSHRCSLAFPGDFNRACSLLFGGHYLDVYGPQGDISNNNGKSDKGDSSKATKPLLTRPYALKVFQTALAAYANEAVFDEYNARIEAGADLLKSVNPLNSEGSSGKGKSFTSWLEVTEILPSPPPVKQMYSHGAVADCQPLGRLRASTWYHPGDLQEDLTVEEEAEYKKTGRPVRQFSFLVDDSLLQNLVKGMKFRARVYEFTFGGLCYFDTVTGILCSFFKWLPNMDMMGWREHVYLPPRETQTVGGGQAFVRGGDGELKTVDLDVTGPTADVETKSNS